MSVDTPPRASQLARWRTLCADPSRAIMLRALMDGSMRPAGELARTADIGAATASAHLQRLVEGGLLARDARGRHRYFRLVNDEVAAWLKAVTLSPRLAPVVLVATPDARLRRARTCYRHLAGQLGVALCGNWLQRGWLEACSDGLRLRPEAAAALADVGWPPGTAQRLPALHGRTCLDWTERHMHVGGALGTSLTDGMLGLDWLRRVRHERALVPSAKGLRQLGLLGVSV